MAKKVTKKENETAKSTGLVLMSKKDIVVIINKVGSLGAEFASTLHLAAVQCILHAETHRDCTLADKLVKTVRETTPGYVWQGLVTWFKRNSPIAWDAEGKPYLLKEGEPGYKPFDVQNADAHPAGEQKEVKGRTDRPIQPMSVALLKSYIKGLNKRIENAEKEGGVGFFGQTPEEKAVTKSQCKTFLDNVVSTMDRISFLPVESGKVEAETESLKSEPAKKAA